MHLCVEFFDEICLTSRCEFRYSAESEPEGFLTMKERAVQNFFFTEEWVFQMEKECFQQEYFYPFQFILKPVIHFFFENVLHR